MGDNCQFAGLVVGGGLARPEVRTFVNSGWVTSINAERGNLGTDKSVPYKYPRQTQEAEMCKLNTDLADFHGFTRIRSCKNPRKSAFNRILKSNEPKKEKNHGKQFQYTQNHHLRHNDGVFACSGYYG
ncbi:MAG: hypothetical protein FWG87_03545 [Defluviitaleaceae bacterium]|nr:hypothetical protein [Defluviitaleaceae bacterium]